MAEQQQYERFVYYLADHLNLENKSNLVDALERTLPSLEIIAVDTPASLKEALGTRKPLFIWFGGDIGKYDKLFDFKNETTIDIDRNEHLFFNGHYATMFVEGSTERDPIKTVLDEALMTSDQSTGLNSRLSLGTWKLARDKLGVTISKMEQYASAGIIESQVIADEAKTSEFIASNVRNKYLRYVGKVIEAQPPIGTRDATQDLASMNRLIGQYFPSFESSDFPGILTDSHHALLKAIDQKFENPATG